MYCKSCGIKIKGDSPICPHCKYNFEKPYKRTVTFPDIKFKPIHFWTCGFEFSLLIFFFSFFLYPTNHGCADIGCTECAHNASLDYIFTCLFFGIPLKLLGGFLSFWRSDIGAYLYLTFAIIFKCILTSTLSNLDFNTAVSYFIIILAGLSDCICAGYLLYSIKKQERIIAKRLSSINEQEHE